MPGTGNVMLVMVETQTWTLQFSGERQQTSLRDRQCRRAPGPQALCSCGCLSMNCLCEGGCLGEHRDCLDVQKGPGQVTQPTDPQVCAFVSRGFGQIPWVSWVFCTCFCLMTPSTVFRPVVFSRSCVLGVGYTP